MSVLLETKLPVISPLHWHDDNLIFNSLWIVLRNDHTDLMKKIEANLEHCFAEDDTAEPSVPSHDDSTDTQEIENKMKKQSISEEGTEEPAEEETPPPAAESKTAPRLLPVGASTEVGAPGVTCRSHLPRFTPRGAAEGVENS